MLVSFKNLFLNNPFINLISQSLDLRHNQLNHLCAQSLSDVIYRNSTLQYLGMYLYGNGLFLYVEKCFKFHFKYFHLVIYNLLVLCVYFKI